MSTISIRTLEAGDVGALLDFELANRAWFERSINPRAPEFYTTASVAAHIGEYLDEYARGLRHPCVLLDQDGAIVGRANLKNIVDGSAEVGYRIAQHCAGMGLATQALRHLADVAQSQWQLGELVAYVTVENLASAKVLEKGGFVCAERIENMALVAQVMLDGHRFVRRFGAAG